MSQAGGEGESEGSESAGSTGQVLWQDWAFREPQGLVQGLPGSWGILRALLLRTAPRVQAAEWWGWARVWLDHVPHRPSESCLDSAQNFASHP